MVKRYVQHIALILTMLLLGGIINEVWAVKVTYHILTLPFDVKNKDGETYKWTAVRVEALRCTSTEDNIGLPAEFKSPLATNFRYYRGVTCSHSNTMLYDNDGDGNNKVQPLSVTYDIYEETDLTGATLLNLSSPVAAEDGEHIYVTYDYIGNDPAVNKMLLLNGSQSYNIKIYKDDNKTERFFCLNRSRNNRPGAANAKALTAEQLASEDFVVPTPGSGANQLGFSWSTASDAGLPGICLRFKFTGNDPYNVTIMTAYTGTATYTEKLNVEGTRYKKTYAGSSYFAKFKATGTEKGWMSPDADRHYKTTDNESSYDSWQGFYRGDMNPIFNAVAVLPKGTNDFIFVGSKLNQNGTTYQPNASGQYTYLSGESANDPVWKFRTLDKIPTAVVYEIHTYTLKVKTPFSDAPLLVTMDWSEDKKTESILDHIPAALQRKYVSFTGAYSDESCTNEISTFAESDAAGNGRVIWLKYTSSMPFEALPVGGSYADAHWYTIRMNGDHEDQYVVKYNTSNFITGGGSNSDIHVGENSAEAQVAFIGDPFELKIISRAGSEAATAESESPAEASHNRYIGCAAEALDGTNFSLTTGSSDISTWEIVSDATSGTMVLRQYGTYASPKYIGWHYGETGNPIYYKTEGSRIKVVDLDKKNYVYHIVRRDGSIAVMASESQYVGNPLKYANIPEIIRSPFIASTWGSTLTFYSDAACTSAITHAAYDVTESTKHIYVKYTLPTVPSSTYNVRLNGQYIYYDSTEPTIKSADAPENDNKYVWNLDFSDPYAMTVKNQEADKYIKIDGEADNNVGLVWDESSENSTKFIVKSSTITGIYEVMVATGNGVDAATTYYNIGRPAANTVKIYSNASYQHGNAQLRFLLTPTSAVAVTYHLIDKSNKKLLDVTSRREDLFFPADYRTPLVDDDGYHYWATESMSIAGDTYTVNGGSSEITKVTDVIGPKTYTETDHGTDAAAYTNAAENMKMTASDNDDYIKKRNALSAVGTYQFNIGNGTKYVTVTVSELKDQQIYVTYDTNNSINLQKGVMYLLEFEAGDNFRQEDGADDLLADATSEEMAANTYKYKAVYPYCNGDCNFFVYGKEQYDIQQQGAASTRTRWAWYVESANNDPYHVKICSRQTETYNSDENQAYFRTYVQNYGEENHVVTSLAWPGVSGIQGTEYMVLGSAGQYQLVTTNSIDDGATNERRTVNSFEQYWKTFDTIRKKIYGHNISNNDLKETDPSTVPNDVYYNYASPTEETLRHYLETTLGFHHYSQWAYAKRWNGYNKDGAKSKGWEAIEHWYQTINMGEGYFDFKPISIDPVIILLDQHGWEIMRKPIPSNDNYDLNDEKFDAIRPYDSPMVKEYYFWTKTSKRSGYHQYHTLTNQVTVNGEPYVSSSLADLPSYSATNVKDKKGNLLDLYVTYTVKDEYVQSYNYTYTGVYDAKNKVTQITNVIGVGQPFLIQQGDKYAVAINAGATTITPTVPKDGETTISMSQFIINGNIDSNAKWYLKPNVNIDKEMGYGNWEQSWTNDYDVKEKVKASGFNSNAFDPYNIQISNVEYTTKYFVTNATNAELDGEGSMVATYGGGAATLSLGAQVTINGTGHDSRMLDMTNATFMAVQDANGNMQLMPRFDHSVRVRNFGTLVTPTAEVGDPTKLTQTYTKLFRPIVYEYHIIDNSGTESLRYKSGGDLVPQMPAHFKSPLAKDFKYYFDHQAAYNTPVASTEEEWTNHAGDFQKTATDEADMISKVKAFTTLGDYYFKIGSTEFTYKKVTVTNLAGSLLTDVAAKTDISNKEITESFAGIGLIGNNNDVYIRYAYDEEADRVTKILKGKWLTMQLNGMDAVYNSDIKQASISKPDPVNASYKDWQWKLLETPQSTPDPYAVYLYNRSQSAGTEAIDKRFALLPHTSGGYALAVAGSGLYTYNFLNGSSMNKTTAATTATEAGFSSTSCTFSGTNSQVQLIDDIEHTFTYKVYTNNGVLAISEKQGNFDLVQNDFVPILPEAARTPLLNEEDYRYYNQDNITLDGSGNITATDTLNNSLSNLYGLYDDVVCVHYLPYSELTSSYKVPNDMANVGGVVAPSNQSNGASLGLTGNLLYNIVWYNDKMMKNNGDAIDFTLCGDLNPIWTPKADDTYEWLLEGDDPYAIKVKSVGASNNETNKYVHDAGSNTCNLDASATTFMLLNRGGYDYGVLAKTGDKTTMLSGYGNALTTGDPTKFIIFALATHKVIYHLVIAKTARNLNDPEDGCYETIPYWNGSTVIDKKIPGSTQRDLTSKINEETSIAGDKYQLGVSLKTIAPSATRDMLYCYDAGHISLGDVLKVPNEFYRPNVIYQFFVEGVYNNVDCSRSIDYGAEGTHIADLDGDYRGREVTRMGTDSRLLGKTVLVNIVYSFDGDLETNSGADFVRAVTDNKWYTFETNDATPWLAQFTNAWGLEVKEGRGTHYTNDYLWSPLGDPYGFRMYNRYIYKNSGTSNSGEDKRVMTTIDYSDDEPSGDGPFVEEKPVTMTVGNSTEPTADPNNVYELLAEEFTTPGYFYVHPVANSEGTKYYLRTKAYDEVGKKGTFVVLSTTPTEFTFGLSDELVKPYFDLVGYVGALKSNVASSTDFVVGDKHIDVKAIATAIKNGTPLTTEQLMDAQSVIYNDANIEPFASGYYRLHSPDGISGISGIHYASGYTHAKERDPNVDGDEADAIPMHFYETKGSSTTFALLRNGNGVLNKGYTSTAATQGDIPIPAVEYDPASIFYITGTVDNAKISTQGLYVKGAKGKQESDDDGKGESVGERAKAYMTSTPGDASELWVMDIGGAVMLIHDRSIPKFRKYLSYDQTDVDHIYDLKLTHNTHTDHAKWCLQPANNLGLRITTHSGGDTQTYGGNTYNYTTFYAPFDILLPDDVPNKTDKTKNDKQYKAFICDSKNSPWEPPADLHPKPIGVYNIAANSCPEAYRGKDKFIPAGTPVIIAAIDNTGYIQVSLPTSSPSTSASLITGFQADGDATTRKNILSGEYLEQLLGYANPSGSNERIYSFGLPFSGTLTPNWSNGEVSAVLPAQENAGVGFYLNANPNKEAGLSKADWIRNNWYVYGNKVYYHETVGGGGGAPQLNGVQFVPVIFGDEEPGEEELQPDGTREVIGDGCIYDLLGRKVATREQVEDGTWRERLAPGIYILNGKKFKK